MEAEEEIVIQALRIYLEKNVDFTDAYSALNQKGTSMSSTWDEKDFKNLECEFFTQTDLIEKH